MDSMIRVRYRKIADDNKAELAPVGAVWNYIRSNHPEIELYSADESHPSYTGAYAAALTFYSAIFRKTPFQTGFIGELDSETALKIKKAVREVVFNDLEFWNIGLFDQHQNLICRGLSIENELKQNSSPYEAFPNPFEGSFKIKPSEFKTQVFELYNIHGSLMRSFEINSETEVQPTDLPKGIYLLKRRWNDQSGRRMIKQ